VATQPPLTHASDAQLSAAVEAHFNSWFRSMAGVLGGDLEETPRLSRYHCAPGSPIFSGLPVRWVIATPCCPPARWANPRI